MKQSFDALLAPSLSSECAVRREVAALSLVRLRRRMGVLKRMKKRCRFCSGIFTPFGIKKHERSCASTGTSGTAG
jgi:hypothetical protein